MLAALRRNQTDWERGFLAATLSHCFPCLAPQLSRRRDGMGWGGGALAAKERPGPAKQPRVGWSRLLAAPAGPEPGRGGDRSAAPAGGQPREGRPRAALSPARRPRRRKGIPSARSCPSRHPILGGILPCGGKRRLPKAWGEVPGAVRHGGARTRSICTDPCHLERWREQPDSAAGPAAYPAPPGVGAGPGALKCDLGTFSKSSGFQPRSLSGRSRESGEGEEEA